MKNLSDMEFVGIVEGDIILKNNQDNCMETYPYKCRSFASNHNTLLSFIVDEKVYYLLQYAVGKGKIRYKILTEAKCKKIIEKNIDNLIQGKVFKL